MRFKPDRIILHCAASGDYSPDNKAFDLIGAKDIDYWHTEGRKKAGKRPFAMIGYHRVIRQSGVIENGRPLTMNGAHTIGENHRAFGICLVGTREFTAQQILSLGVLYSWFNFEYGITADDWYPHRQFANKECPGLPIELLRAYFLEREKSWSTKS